MSAVIYCTFRVKPKRFPLQYLLLTLRWNCCIHFTVILSIVRLNAGSIVVFMCHHEQPGEEAFVAGQVGIGKPLYSEENFKF